ncbi:MAG: uroporphyrinogen decarboxylase [Candidatus Methanomethylophilaceae archaeon]|nr:uroporphyrinogen decarboxylase [Candidatus Methanomethylophilaceae archaeon]
MKHEMKSKDRALAVFEGELPDRAPVCDFGNIAMVGHYGYRFSDVRGNPDLARDIMAKWVKETQSDMVFGPFESKGIFMDIPGMSVKLPEDDQGSLRQDYFSTPEEIESKPLYDPFNREECPNLHKYVVDTLRAVHESCPDAMTPVWCEGPLTTSGFLRGIDQLLMDILMDPDNAKKAIKRGAELSRQIVGAQLEEIDADYVVCTDPVSSADMIDDAMFREFNLEELKKSTTQWKQRHGVETVLHICGDTAPMLESFKETGARVLSLDHAVDLAKAREAFKDDVVVMGNLDPVSVLLQGSVDDVDRAAEKCFNDAGRNGGYIFAAGCSVPKNTPIENIVQMANVSKRHAY